MPKNSEGRIPHDGGEGETMTTDREALVKLLPCPFCGGSEAELQNTHTPSFWIECLSCGATARGKYFLPKSKESQHYSAEPRGFNERNFKGLTGAYKKAAVSAMAAWNRRAALSAQGGLCQPCVEEVNFARQRIREFDNCIQRIAAELDAVCGGVDGDQADIHSTTSVLLRRIVELKAALTAQGGEQVSVPREPTTDAAWVDLLNRNVGPGIHNKKEWGHAGVMADFARQLETELSAALQRAEKAESALCGLTPGGSEYAGDPQACVEYVRRVRESQHSVIVEFKAELSRYRDAEKALPEEPSHLLRSLWGGRSRRFMLKNSAPTQPP